MIERARVSDLGVLAVVCGVLVALGAGVPTDAGAGGKKALNKKEKRALAEAAVLEEIAQRDGLAGVSTSVVGPVEYGAPVSAQVGTAQPSASGERLAPGGAGGADHVPEGVGEEFSAPTSRVSSPRDPVMQGGAGVSELLAAGAPDVLGAPDVNVAGMGTAGGPPDTVGDVGPNHYVQMINNTNYLITDKDGTIVQAATSFGSLWPAADQCRTNRGDPIVVYDHLADRWLMMMFSFAAFDAMGNPVAPYFLCFAISQTPDPTGSYYLYTFNVGNSFPDYPKIGVWPDGYYQTTYESSTLGIWVFDRAAMLSGFAAGWLKTSISDPTPDAGSGVRDTRILPADLDGPPPPAGTANPMVRTIDSRQDNTSVVDKLEIWDVSVDWFAPTITLGGPLTLSPAAFNVMACDRNNGAAGNLSVRDCIPQPVAGNTVDALSNRPMMQLKYRNFGTHEAMVFNQTIDVQGSINFVLGFTPQNEVAGIRWYELRRGGGAWAIQQQGTYAPQPIGATTEAELLHRWMGSAAMDKHGNIAMGYSLVNSDNTNPIHPGINYTGRTAGDLAGVMTQGDQVVQAGVNSQTTGLGQRWGDYSALSVDPVDDCTFWFTTHLAGTGGNGGKPTRIASFRFADCEQVDLAVTKVDDPDPVNAGEQLFYDIEVTNFGTNPATDVVVTDTLPAEVTYVTDTGGCTQPIVGGAVIICEIDEILPGDSFDFEIKVLVDPDVVALNGGPLAIDNHVEVTSPQPDVDDSNNEAWASTIVDDTADIKATKLCKPDRLLAAGEVGECTIFIDNHGPSWARNVYVLDSLVSDGDFTILGVEPAADCMAMATTWACALGDLAAAPSPNSRTEVVVTLMANDQVDINDLTFAMSDTFDPDYDNNQSHGSIQVQGIADLAITKTDDPDPVIAGTQLTYTLSVTNGGPSDAENVVINDILPAEVEVISVVGSHGAMCNAGVPGDASQPTSCAYGLIEVGAPARTMTIVVLVDPDALGVIQNDAEVVSDTFDSNNADNFDTETTTVEADADLEIAKEAIPNPLPHGDPLTYIVTITNNGPSTAVGVVLEDTLPEETTFLQATIFDGTGTCVQLGGMPRQINCSLNDLWPGDFVTVIIEVATEECLEHLSTIDNLAIASAVTPDSDLLNNTVLQETVIWNEADVSIDKDGPDEGYEWWPLTYTITVTNDGPQKACDVEVVDHLPKTPWKVAYMSTTGPCIYTKSEHRLDCDLGTLGIGEVVEFEVTVKPKIYWVWITNIVDVFTSSFDPDLNNNHDEHDTWISY